MRRALVGHPVLLLTLLAALVPSSHSVASAASGPALVLVETNDFSPLGENAAMVRSAIANRLGRENAYRGIRDAEMLELLKSAPRAATSPSMARAFESLRAGKEKYENLELGEAVSLLESARGIIESNISELPSVGVLIETLLYLGLAHLANGDEAKGGNFFALAVSMDTGLRLDAARFSPTVIAAFELVRNRTLSLDTAMVGAPGLPADASVLINGRKVESFPASIPGLPGSVHQVRIERQGFLPIVIRIAVAGRGKISLPPLSFEPADDSTVQGELRSLLSAKTLDVAEVLKRVRKISGRLEFERLVLASLSQSSAEAFEIVFFAFKKTEGKIGYLGTVSRAFNLSDMFWLNNFKFGLDGVAELFSKSPLYAPARPAEPAPASSLAMQGSETPKVAGESGAKIYEKWWFWSAVGTGVVACTAAAIAVSSGEKSQSSNNTGSVTVNFPLRLK